MPKINRKISLFCPKHPKDFIYHQDEELLCPLRPIFVSYCGGGVWSLLIDSNSNINVIIKSIFKSPLFGEISTKDKSMWEEMKGRSGSGRIIFYRSRVCILVSSSHSHQQGAGG